MFLEHIRRKVIHFELEDFSFRRYRWLLDLACGHMVVKVQSSRIPPKTTNCYICEKAARTAAAAEPI